MSIGSPLPQDRAPAKRPGSRTLTIVALVVGCALALPTILFPPAAAADNPQPTATPFMDLIGYPEDVAEPAPWETRYPDLPAGLVGKILFLTGLDGEEDVSDGGECDYCPVYAFDPATRLIFRLRESWPHAAAEARDRFSANRQYEAYVEEPEGDNYYPVWPSDPYEWVDAGWGDAPIGEEETVEYNPVDACYYASFTPAWVRYYDREFDVRKPVTHFDFGAAWDPVWSPVDDLIAFVANESCSDEIWVARKDEWPPRQLTRNTWEWDKHPSWSPDGKQIVFMSNRTGTEQIWIMNADGSGQHQLFRWPTSAHRPVWVKFVR